MKWLSSSLILVMIFDVLGLTMAHGFVVRHVNSSFTDYEDNLQRSEEISYVDWHLHEIKNRDYKLSDLDSALALSLDHPQKSLDYFRSAIAELTKQPLNESGRELLVAIYLKVVKLKIPDRLRELYRTRATDLIAFHKELENIPEYRVFFDKYKSNKDRRNLLLKKETEIFKNKWKSRKAFDEAQLLINGLPQNLTSSWLPPRGTHQWIVITNAYSVFHSFGSWNEFYTEFLKDSNFKPLLSEECSKVKLDVDDYILQTQALLFYSNKCTPLKQKNQQYVHHLSALPDKEVSSFGWFVPAVVLGAGITYSSLQGKSIKFIIPTAFK